MTADRVLTSPTAGVVGSSKESAVASSKDRQPIAYCPYCSEETLFPREGGGWECHSCLRAFSVSFLGLSSPRLVDPDGDEQS